MLRRFTQWAATQSLPDWKEVELKHLMLFLEHERARQLECLVVKVFPAVQLGGPEFLQAVSATYPDVSFIPTGGIDAGSVGDYLAVPSVVACGGSWLARPEAVRAGRFDEIERLARETRESFA